MTKVFASIAAVTLAIVPAIASAETSAPVSFTHAGVLYTYTIEQVGEREVLRGHSGTGREPFVLTVSKGWVDGTVDGRKVSFSRRSVKHFKGIARVEHVAAR